MLASDVSAQEMEGKLGGRMVAMRFDHNQMRMSELYWQHTTRGKLGYYGIVDQAIHRTYVGLGALCYGAVASAAMSAGKPPVTMTEFDRMTHYDDLRPLAEQMIDAVIASMPRGNAKNAEGRPQETKTITRGEALSGQRCEPASDTGTFGG